MNDPGERSDFADDDSQIQDLGAFPMQNADDSDIPDADEEFSVHNEDDDFKLSRSQREGGASGNNQSLVTQLVQQRLHAANAPQMDEDDDEDDEDNESAQEMQIGGGVSVDDAYDEMSEQEVSMASYQQSDHNKDEFKVHNEQLDSKPLASTNVFKEKALAPNKVSQRIETPEEAEEVASQVNDEEDPSQFEIPIPDDDNTPDDIEDAVDDDI